MRIKARLPLGNIAKILTLCVLMIFACICCTCCATTCEHSFVDYISNGDAICGVDGTKTAQCEKQGCTQTHTVTDEGSALQHIFTSYISNGDATCNACGTQTAYCERSGCNQTHTVSDQNGVLPHIYGAYVSNNDATCTQYGTATALCARCGNASTVTDVNSQPHHLFDFYISNNDATCTLDGTYTATCSRSGCNESNTITKLGSKLGHSFELYINNDDHTCLFDGTATARCSREGCTETHTLSVPNSSVHRFDNQGKCTACSYVCPHEERDSVISQPSCTQEGSAGELCKACGAFLYQQTINVTTHEFVVVNTIYATCNEAGFAVYQCKSCGIKRSICTQTALQHNYVNGRCDTCGESCPPYYCEVYQSLFANNGITFNLDNLDVSAVLSLLPLPNKAESLLLQSAQISLILGDGELNGWAQGTLDSNEATFTFTACIEQTIAYCEITSGNSLYYATVPLRALFNLWKIPNICDKALYDALLAVKSIALTGSDDAEVTLGNLCNAFFSCSNMSAGKKLVLEQNKLRQFCQQATVLTASELYDAYFSASLSQQGKEALISLLTALAEYLCAEERQAILNELSVCFDTDQYGVVDGNKVVLSTSQVSVEANLSCTAYSDTFAQLQELKHRCQISTKLQKLDQIVTYTLNSGETVTCYHDQQGELSTVNVIGAVHNVSNVQRLTLDGQELTITFYQVTEYDYTLQMTDDLILFANATDDAVVIIGKAIGLVREYTIKEVRDSTSNALLDVKYIYQQTEYDNKLEQWWVQTSSVGVIVYSASFWQ